MSRPLNRLGSVGLALLATLTTILIYWPGLHGGFFFDDYPNIIDNKGVLLKDVSFSSLQATALSGISGIFSRPVSQLSFAVNYYFSGFDPFVFKLTNLVIHCLNAFLVYFLALQLFKGQQSGFLRADVRLYAAGVAIVWMIHPIQLTSVLYVVQRMTSLAALFMLLALLLHIRVRCDDSVNAPKLAILFLAWAVFWPLSILSKEIGLLFPGFVMAYELIVRRSISGGLDAVGRGFKWITLISALLVPLYLLSPLSDWIFSGYNIRAFSLDERLMSEARIFWEYLRLIFFPAMEAFGLYHDDMPLSTGLFSPWTTLPAIFGLLGIVLIGFLVRKKFPLITFGIAWFFIGHALESTFIPLELMHEHRNYLPLFGVCVVLIVGIGCLINRPGVKRTIGIALFAAFLIYCMLITALRCEMFRNDQIRTQVEAQHHPNSARANYEAGRALVNAFDQDRSNMMAFTLARKHFERSNEFDTSYKMGFLGLLTLECAALDKVDPAIIDSFARRLNETPFSPEDRNLMSAVSAMSVAGTLCLTRNDLEKLFFAALQNPKTSPDAKVRLHVWLADYLWLYSKDLPAAKSSIRQALTLQPTDTSNRFKWAQLVYISGEKGVAKKLLNDLQGQPLSSEEKKTFDELLNSFDTPGNK